jgi:hypothetical protein
MFGKIFANDLAKTATKITAADAAKVAAKVAAADLAKVAAINSTKVGILQTSKNFITKNATKIIAGGAASAVALQALNEYNDKNDKKYNVISITINSSLFSNVSTISIQYTSNGDKLTNGDVFTLSDTNSIPSTDGTYTITSSSTAGNVGTLVAESIVPNLTANGSAGTLTYHTSFSSQLGTVAEHDANFLTKGLTTILGPTVSGLVDSSGISQYGTPILIFISLIIFIFLWLNFIVPSLKIMGVIKNGGRIRAYPTSILHL